jgi:RNA polymerase sigma-70 factor (ECF subfamily)
MDGESNDQRLSRISTAWTVLQQAHEGSADAAAAARQLLVQRYGGAVHRYLLAALRDRHAADDLSQEFALSLVRGAFHKVEPCRGRFRDYVKTVLFRLVSDYRRREQKLARPVANDLLLDVAAPEADDREFKESWRAELMARAGEALAEAHPGHYAVLRFKTDHPDLRSHELAELMSRQQGKSISAAGFRQALSRGREMFINLVIHEVALSLQSPTREEIEQELAELNLLEQCKTALAKWPWPPLG